MITPDNKIQYHLVTNESSSQECLGYRDESNNTNELFPKPIEKMFIEYYLETKDEQSVKDADEFFKAYFDLNKQE